jgi:hypothetical protein
MAIMAKAPESNFTPAPEGLHSAVCADVVELGTEVNQFNGGLQEKVRIVWQLDAMDPQTQRRYEASQKYTLSLHEKAKLTGHLEAWRGRKFSTDEKQGFDLEKLIGVSCQIQVVHNITDNGRTFANVQAVVPLGKGMVKLRVSDSYVRFKDRKQQPSATQAQHEQDEDDLVPF